MRGLLSLGGSSMFCAVMSALRGLRSERALKLLNLDWFWAVLRCASPDANAEVMHRRSHLCSALNGLSMKLSMQLNIHWLVMGLLPGPAGFVHGGNTGKAVKIISRRRWQFWQKPGLLHLLCAEPVSYCC